MREHWIDTLRWSVVSAGTALVTLSCATVVQPNDQAVRFTSDPPGARVFINSVKRGVTPVTVLVPRSAEAAIVKVEKEGYRTESFPLEETMSPVLLGNVLIGGLVGLAIDSASGKGQDYVGSVHVDLDESEVLPRPTGGAKAGTDPMIKDRKRDLMRRYHEGGITRSEYLRRLQRVGPGSAHD